MASVKSILMSDESNRFVFEYKPPSSIWAQSSSEEKQSWPRASQQPQGTAYTQQPLSFGVSPVGQVGVSGLATPAQRAPSSSSGTGAPAMPSQSSASANTSSEEDLILTAIVVKNIPFAIKKEQLLEVMTQMGLPLPYAFNYHFDNGVFRGLAFANFTSPDETAMVISQLNGREIGGRKLRVEYKKMLPPQERERIEREKRERRGQLEEQHQSLGGAGGSASGMESIPSVSPIMSTASSPNQSSAQALHGPLAQMQHSHPIISPAQQPGQTATQSQQQQHTPGEAALDYNDPETLEIYSGLLLFREDKTRHELHVHNSCVTPQMNRIFTVLCEQFDLCITSSESQAAITITKQRAFQDSGFFHSSIFQHQPTSISVPSTPGSSSRHSSWTQASVFGPQYMLSARGQGYARAPMNYDHKTQ